MKSAGKLNGSKLPLDNSISFRRPSCPAWRWPRQGRSFGRRRLRRDRNEWVRTWNPPPECLMLPYYWRQWTKVYSPPIESNKYRRIDAFSLSIFCAGEYNLNGGFCDNLTSYSAQLRTDSCSKKISDQHKFSKEAVLLLKLFTIFRLLRL